MHRPATEQIVLDLQGAGTRLGKAAGQAASAAAHAERVQARSGRTGFRRIAQGMAETAVMLKHNSAHTTALAQSVEKATAALRETADAANPDQVTAKLAAAATEIRNVRAGMDTALTDLAQIQTHIAAVLRGGKPQRLLAIVDSAKQAVLQAVAHLDSAQRKLTEAANETDQIGAGASGETGPVPTPASDPARPNAGNRLPTGADTAAEFEPAPLMATLPPRVRGRGGGEKTRGILVDSDGTTQEVVSGEGDADYQRANEHARRIGLTPQKATLFVASHVEIKTAMRLKPGQHANLVINNDICRGLLGCRALIAKFLVPGATLTVHGPNGFKETFEGKSKTR
jgi:hypothetical protein